MMRRIRLGAAWLAWAGVVTAVSVTAWVEPAAAQGSPSASRSGFQPQFLPKYKNKSRDPAPPALPGAVPRVGEAPNAPASLDLPPTEALFDAINRGDIAEARDALTRGADLQGSNVLGMTPIALSVDLSRNDITFLLLSFRGAGSAAQAPAAVAPAQPARRTAPGSAQPKSAQPKSSQPNSSQPGPTQTESTQFRFGKAGLAKTKFTQAGAPSNPSPGSPGVPIPQAGFLGFGGTASN